MNRSSRQPSWIPACTILLVLVIPALGPSPADAQSLDWTVESQRRAPGVLLPLHARVLTDGSSPTVVLDLLVQNTGFEVLDQAFVTVRRENRRGETLEGRSLRLQVDLQPGASRDVTLEIELAMAPQDRLVVGWMPALQEDLAKAFEEGDSGRDEIRRLQEIMASRMDPDSASRQRSLVEQLQALEKPAASATSVSGPEADSSLVLDACLNFCLRCVQAASIVCTGGVSSLDCNCSQGSCSFVCK